MPRHAATLVLLPPLDNPARTAQFLAMMEERRRDLRARFAQILPAGKPFVWEVGCGHGHFLTAYAQTHPNETCVGVDLVSERIERANKKRDRAKLPNLHFLHAEARLFLEMLPAEARFSRLFILFPDPWPKLRHHKHRIMQPDFLSDAAERAGEGARLYFRTDFTPYFDDTCVVFREHPAWSLEAAAGEVWPFEQETVFQSRAESYHSLVAAISPYRSPRPSPA